MNKLFSIFLIILMAGCACRTRHSSDMRAMMVPENLPSETAGPLQSIHFAFDSDAMSAAAKTTIRDNIAWLKRNGNPQVELGGNCDERGTNAYNMVLGLKRAHSTMNYIVSLGEDPQQFTSLSYGEEMPADPAHTEAAWARNRRVDFNVK